MFNCCTITIVQVTSIVRTWYTSMTFSWSTLSSAFIPWTYIPTWTISFSTILTMTWFAVFTKWCYTFTILYTNPWTWWIITIDTSLLNTWTTCGRTLFTRKIDFMLRTSSISYTSSHNPVDQRTDGHRALLDDVQVSCSTGIGCGHFDRSIDRPSWLHCTRRRRMPVPHVTEH